ncbi:uncharacterized protein J4E92_002217 [Alternaria infectoria]|uniref:uncharacterized protein n=1 Tax=Alternaria infectoria TaxID=45303 RepID=UPI00221E5D4B|nr:uncharacterized protein J4E92_002217 [Alternaria infectoria]KAI4937486.1 hypothetical protein J4E92_002217 [Alternaria infectoria]
MSFSSKHPSNGIANHLRATAATFTPLASKSDAKSPHNYERQNDITCESSSSLSPHAQADETSDTSNARVNVGADGSEHKIAERETKMDCTFCDSLDQPLQCCQSLTLSHPCPHCDELSQLFTRKTEEHKDEIATLQDKLQRLEKESLEQKFTRLCDEKNTKIDMLKREVEKINKEDESLKAENKELEKKLKMLEAEINKLQPPAAFTVKEKKTKGKKK